ncbi:MAG: hypothetical protein ACW98U_15200 [Candidatus Thorarchaeota archaeon]|jgi:hypothetical protein
MEVSALSKWLVENAGPVIKFRTLLEILQEQDIGIINDAMKGLYSSQMVQKWLERLKPNVGFHHVHSSSPMAFENVMGKLVQLGLHAGLQPFDGLTLPFRAWLSERVKEDAPEGVGPWEGFSEMLLTGFLAYAGYADTTPVKTMTLERLRKAHWFSENIDFDDFYVRETKKEWLVNPQFYQEVEYGLPFVHDIRGFASSPWIFENRKYSKMVEQIVAMILSPEYQTLKNGYGYMKYEKRIYAIGWSVHLPNYLTPAEENEMSKLLLNLELLAPFETARNSEWFGASLSLLEDQQTEEGHYRFPRKWLPERPSGYWVGGHYMALEDDRRKQAAIDYESTFRVLKIKRLAGFI